MTMADMPGQYGANNHPMEMFSAPREALVVLYWEMRAESHRRIRMVIEMASKPRVLFFHRQLETKVVWLLF